MVVTGMVYYCPDLRLYRYKVDDSSNPETSIDTKFDAEELEDILVSQFAAAANVPKAEKELREQQARSLANVTGIARINPHKIVTFEAGAEFKANIMEAAEYWKKYDAEREEREAREGG